MTKLFLAALRGYGDCALRAPSIASRPATPPAIEQLEHRTLLSLPATTAPQLDLDLSDSPIVAAAESIDVTIALTTSARSVTYGQAVTFTAKVTSSAGAPSGTVSFWDGQTLLGSIELSASGKASLAISSLSAGSHNITVVYDGDATFAPQGSAPVVQNVTRASASVVLKKLPRQAALGQSVTFTAVAYPQAPSTATPQGWVTLYDGKRKFGRFQLVNGRGSATLAKLAAGQHRIVAYYSGNESFAASTSSAASIYITAPPTTTTITTSADSLPLGQPVTFTATIDRPAADTTPLTGWITFMDEDRILGYSLISGSQGALTASSLGEGQHKITAVYSGDATHQASTSRPITQNVPYATIVDLMALYTSRASRQIGGVEAIHRTIANAVNDMNQALLNSEIPLTIRLVYEGLIKYEESGSYDTDLERLFDRNDGYLDDAHSLRDQYGADLVTLFEGDADMGGLAYQMQNPKGRDNPDLGFSVVRIQQADAPVYTLAHELGHNFGAAHDVENSDGPGVFADSYGYRFTAQGTEYHDIMSYDPGITIPYYSNPNITYKGMPIGEAGLANVARAITLTAPVVASYRTQVVRGTTPTQIVLDAPVSFSTPGQSVLFRAVITARDPGAGLPMGKIVFKDGNKILGTAKIASGVATWSTTRLPAGSHTITAVYRGDSNFAASSSSSIPHRVRNA